MRVDYMVDKDKKPYLRADSTDFWPPSKYRAHVPQLARKMLSEGCTVDTILEVYRGDTKCFEDMSILKWSVLDTTNENSTGLSWRTYRKFEGV